MYNSKFLNIQFKLKYLLLSRIPLKNEKDETSEMAATQTEEGGRKINETSINKEEPIGVPHVIIENVNKSDIDEVFKNSKFPPIEEVIIIIVLKIVITFSQQ